MAKSPARTPSCVTAVVNGNTMRKRVFATGLGRSFNTPAQMATRNTTTSMPIPRPDKPVTSVAVVKPGAKISYQLGIREGCWHPANRSTVPSGGLSRFRPRPSSANTTDTSLPSCDLIEWVMLPRTFARCRPLCGRLDTMVHAMVRSKCSKKWGHAVSYQPCPFRCCRRRCREPHPVCQFL